MSEQKIKFATVSVLCKAATASQECILIAINTKSSQDLSQYGPTTNGH